MWALFVSVWGILNKTFKNSRAPEWHINQKGKKFHLLGILKCHLEPTKYNQCQKRVKKYITVSHTKLPSVPTHLSPSWEVRTDGGRGFPFLLMMLLTALCSLGFFASTLLLLLCWHPGLTATSRLHVKGGGDSYLTYQQLGTLVIISSFLMTLLHLASRASHSWLSANLTGGSHSSSFPSCYTSPRLLMLKWLSS